ncbi:hypothetical protein CALCODRAFT_87557 [Calocera cornea HHB12733]|uniref:Uncharacterized protein n=1 Tax=Calocera cornea HHB12733 TaxID=1353952 RepID=A0A165DC82_9BASI|nr:hypothetical protein CALCODRAFT_87557 [Calocera cornea HHB12733]
MPRPHRRLRTHIPTGSSMARVSTSRTAPARSTYWPFLCSPTASGALFHPRANPKVRIEGSCCFRPRLARGLLLCCTTAAMSCE